MEPICIAVSGNTAAVTGGYPPVSGTGGLTVQLSFSPEWEALSKTAVFRANGRTMDCVRIQERATVPWELLKNPGCRLWVGVYGTNEDGTVQIPTAWADLGVIVPGADPSGDESAAPSLPVWEQLSGEMEAALDEIIRYQSLLINGDIVPVHTAKGSDQACV